MTNTSILGVDRSEKYPLLGLVCEGKTKIVHGVAGNATLAVLSAKDDITAGDGKKHDRIEGKAKLATQTACNVFRLLKDCGIPVAFYEQISDTQFVGQRCTMLPYEVVVRRQARGSYLKRNPHLKAGHRFGKLLVEFFLKTKDRKWKQYDLPCDDPFMLYDHKDFNLYLPDKPISEQKPFLKLPQMEVFTDEDDWKSFPLMEGIARKTFLVLEKAWDNQGRRQLADFKVEFGFDTDGNLLLADVIDNDSWRVMEDGAHIDKQVYRDGGGLSDVAVKYRHVAELTDRFSVPRQQVVLWRGSESDKVEEIEKLLRDNGALTRVVTCSMHKQPALGLGILSDIEEEMPDSVIIAIIGMSNGAGPTLSAQTTIPVLTVPATWKDCPEDVWSSLRAPSKVPVAVVLDPKNAALAALNQLSVRNPKIYAHRRYQVEENLLNLVRV